MKHDSCKGCKHDLGRGRDNCLLNVAYECRDGGGFEAWEAPKEVTVTTTGPIEEPQRYICPNCGEVIEYLEVFDRFTISQYERAKSLLPTKFSDQIVWLSFYTFSMLLLGAVLYKYAVALF